MSDEDGKIDKPKALPLATRSSGTRKTGARKGAHGGSAKKGGGAKKKAGAKKSGHETVARRTAAKKAARHRQHDPYYDEAPVITDRNDDLPWNDEK